MDLSLSEEHDVDETFAKTVLQDAERRISSTIKTIKKMRTVQYQNTTRNQNQIQQASITYLRT
jgi:hypothetical protein